MAHKRATFGTRSTPCKCSRSQVGSLLGTCRLTSEILKRRQQEPTRAACRIGNSHHWFRSHHLDDCSNNRSRREVLSGSASHIISVSGQQAFVNFTFHIQVELRPIFTINHLNEEMKFGRIVDLALRLGKDQANQTRTFAQLAQALMIPRQDAFALSLIFFNAPQV